MGGEKERRRRERVKDEAIRDDVSLCLFFPPLSLLFPL
jgi:hypothetical protein